MTLKAATSKFAPIERLPATGIKVVVSGAGIGGLWTALECWRKGHEVRIFERAPEPQTQGDFVMLNPSACEPFEHWPEMKAEHQTVGSQPLISIYKYDGTCIQSPSRISVNTTDESGANVQMEIPAWRHRRPELQQVLLRQLERIGLEVEYGCRAVKYEEQPDRGLVILEDGHKIEGDIIVAADGIGSKSSELIHGHNIRARSSGSAAYRCAFPIDVLEKDPLLAEHYKLSDGHAGDVRIWMGPDVQYITARNKTMFSWSISHKDDGTSEESWHSTSTPSQPIDAVNIMKSSWGSCPEMIERTMMATPPETLLDWKIMWRDPNVTWVSPLGRVIQLGDAAHTFVPSSGSGAAQAIEDAASLASCLQISGRSNIPLGLRVHNLLRFERVSCCQIMGFKNQANRNIAGRSGKGGADANGIDKAGQGKSPQSKLVTMGRWLWSHDAEQYAYLKYEEAKDHLLNGTSFKNTNIPPGYKYKPWNIDELLEVMNSGKPIVLEGEWDQS